MGPSGCGKSTVLRLVAGLIQPTLGKVTVNGEEVTGPSPERGDGLSEAYIISMADSRKNIAFPLKMQGKLNTENGKEKSRTYVKCDRPGIFPGRLSGQLSGGMAQRVALVRTLISQPEMLAFRRTFGGIGCIYTHEYAG